MVLFSKDAWIWHQSPKEAWVPVRMEEQIGNTIVCYSQADERYDVDAEASCTPVHPASLTPIENMIDLEELSEGSILNNLRQRYSENLIYTYISTIVLSINPCQWVSLRFQSSSVVSPQTNCCHTLDLPQSPITARNCRVEVLLSPLTCMDLPTPRTRHCHSMTQSKRLSSRVRHLVFLIH